MVPLLAVFGLWAVFPNWKLCFLASELCCRVGECGSGAGAVCPNWKLRGLAGECGSEAGPVFPNWKLCGLVAERRQERVPGTPRRSSADFATATRRCSKRRSGASASATETTSQNAMLSTSVTGRPRAGEGAPGAAPHDSIHPKDQSGPTPGRVSMPRGATKLLTWRRV